MDDLEGQDDVMAIPFAEKEYLKQKKLRAWQNTPVDFL